MATVHGEANAARYAHKEGLRVSLVVRVEQREIQGEQLRILEVLRRRDRPITA